VFPLFGFSIPGCARLEIHARVGVDPDHASAVYPRSLLLSRGWLGSSRSAALPDGAAGGWQTGASAEVDAVEPFELFSLACPRYRHFSSLDFVVVRESPLA
jgi:hypothetical protein